MVELSILLLAAKLMQASQAARVRKWQRENIIMDTTPHACTQLHIDAHPEEERISATLTTLFMAWPAQQQK